MVVAGGGGTTGDRGGAGGGGGFREGKVSGSSLILASPLVALDGLSVTGGIPTTYPVTVNGWWDRFRRCSISVWYRTHHQYSQLLHQQFVANACSRSGTAKTGGSGGGGEIAGTVNKWRR